MDVGLDGSNGVASSNRYLFVSETDYVSQYHRPAGPGWEVLQPPMPGGEVDIVRVVRADLDLPVYQEGPATSGPEMVATEVERDRPDPSSQFQVPNAARSGNAASRSSANRSQSPSIKERTPSQGKGLQISKR